LREDARGRCGGAEIGEQPRDRPGIAEAAEDGVDALCADAGEEAPQIQGDDQVLAGMDLRAAQAGTTLGEAMGVVVRCNAVENIMQNLPLNTR
jgi:hypothetical protein